ncbi:hypothetical protein ACVIHI_006821 [Bradyrhizobium sp. USDA 4524]|nr:hypothetical protein [Bradyrhizobium sp. USDA 4538]MCP1900824.1 hypothetical protein [Bradyrhizobium sp. USDA 4537]MCP1993520.1 hypothetical protein [Bradyrhizobium sp. USDA 4539]
MCPVRNVTYVSGRSLPGFGWKATLSDQREGSLPKLRRSVGPMPPDIPTISTARLTLRAQVVHDFPAYQAFLASSRSAGSGYWTRWS